MVRLRRSGGPGAAVRFRRLALGSVAGLVALTLPAPGGAYAATAPALVKDQLVKDPASLVNPLIGTSAGVNTFPGPDMPFGMLQWGPDTTPNRPRGGGYEYHSSKISGFSLAHLSGPGCEVAGDVPLLPVAGPLAGNLATTAARFSHADEHTEIGYYGVTDAAGVTTELTDTTRAGLGRFTYPAGTQANLLLKLSGGATPVDGSRARVVNDHEVSGAVDSGHFCGAGNHYTLHFDIRFNRPFTATGTWTGGTVHAGATTLNQGRAPQPPAQHPVPKPSAPNFTVPTRPAPTVHGGQAAAGGADPGTQGNALAPAAGANGMYLTFDTAGTARPRTVTAAVAISYTSDHNAASNLTAEVGRWDFAAMRRANHRAWNGLLGRVRIGGGSHDQQVQFYTALYHALLHPNVFSDDNGQYAGMDDKVHTLARGQRAQYANYSGWDTYRSQTQLMAAVAPRQTSDIVTSMLNGYDQTGLLPKWAANNGESYVMVGDPADGIIADAYAFGARHFDVAHALAAMEQEATAPSRNRPGEPVRDLLGYLPLDQTGYGCCNFYGPVSTQLEYDTADYAIASLARSLGRTADYRRFATRAQDWRNLFNPQTGYLQGRNRDGHFAAGFTPATTRGFVEGTAAQYTPMVPFDLARLIAARGGATAYSTYLDNLLSNITAPRGTNADLSNEPSLEIPWEYDYLAQPWKTQAVVRRIQRELYSNTPAGSFGNDDLGAMSSWYVWSALGMYPMTPGADTLVLGSPVFPVTRLTLAGGRRVLVSAPQAAPAAPYVRSLAVGGAPYGASWLTFRQVVRAGRLDFALGGAPNTSWAASPGSVPPSDTTGIGPADGLPGAGPAALPPIGRWASSGPLRPSGTVGG